jgi:hypothetical protein
VRRVPFSCFALPYSFSAVPRASGPVFMFCAPRLVFGGAGGVGSRFHVLRARTDFRRYRGRRVPFLCVCAPGLVFGDAGCLGSRFHVFRAWTHFKRYRGRRVQFTCFALPDSFSSVPRASGPVFIFCAPGLVFGARGRRVPFSCFARTYSFSAVPRASGPAFMYCALGLIFGDIDDVGTRFHVSLPNSFSAVLRASGLIFHVLRARSRLHVLRSWTHFRRYRGRRVPFSCFALSDSFSAIPTASRPVFMFPSRTRFRRY